MVSTTFSILLLPECDLDVCPVCRDSAEPGWTCEDHPDKPWRHSGCRGAGAPCVCNPSGAALWAMVYSDALRVADSPVDWRRGVVASGASAGPLQLSVLDRSLG